MNVAAGESRDVHRLTDHRDRRLAALAFDQFVGGDEHIDLAGRREERGGR